MKSGGSYVLNPSLPSALKIPKGAFLTPKEASWSLCLLMSFHHLEAGPLVVLVTHTPHGTGRHCSCLAGCGWSWLSLCFICTFLSSSWRSCCHWDHPWKCSACYVSSSETPQESREEAGSKVPMSFSGWWQSHTMSPCSFAGHKWVSPVPC